MRNALVLTAMLVPLLAGCAAGPGNKPGKLKWKVFKQVNQLRVPTAVFTDRGIRYEMTEARQQARRTLLAKQGTFLYFEFSTVNTTGQKINLADQRPPASLTLQDANDGPSLIWVSRPIYLEPGQSGTATLFGGGAEFEGALPKTLTIAGNTFRW